MGKAKTTESEIELWRRRNLTADVDRLAPAFEVDDTIEAIVGMLGAGHSVFLVGESGVGKTAIVHEMVRQASHLGDQAFPKDREVWQLSFRLRALQLHQPGNLPQLSQRLLALGDELAGLGGVVLPFIEDGDWIASGMGDALVSLVQRLDGPILIEGRPGIVQASFEEQPELEELFVVLPVDEPNLERASRMLSRWEARERVAGRRGFTPEALEEGLELSARFLTRARLPKKAFDLASQTRAAVPEGPAPVDVDTVVDRFCSVHRTPRWLVDPKEPLDIDALDERFRSRLLGQGPAVDAVVSMISLLKAGLSDTRRPFGVFLFAGPTGVGKTHLAQLLATELFGSAERIVRINMADFNEPNAAMDLFGVPGGYTPSMRRGILTRELIGHPFAVLLLDELEKAFPTVRDRFLPIFDEGSFVNGAGETVSLRSTIIVATTNAGAEVYRGQGLGFLLDDDAETRMREVERSIRQTLRFELLNRFDRVVHFRPLDRESVRAVARRELEGIVGRSGFRRRGLHLRVDEAVLDWLAVYGHHPEWGARFLKRTIEREVTAAMAEALTRGPVEDGATVALSVRRNRIRAEVRPRRGEPGMAADAAEAPTSTSHGESRETPSAEAILGRATPLLDDLAAREAERDELLAHMGDAAFWTDDDARERALARFRELDVAVGVERRFAKPLLRLRELVDSTALRDDPNAASILGDARAAVDRWERRRQVEGPAAVWLVLRTVDALHPAEAFLSELLALELAWCRRCEVTARVEAVVSRRRALACAVLEVEGPGAAHFLAAEVGIHRRVESGATDHEVEVAVVPRGSASPVDGDGIREHTPRPGPLGFPIEAEVRLDAPERGDALKLCGREARTLSVLAGDLAELFSRPRADSAPTIRLYGEPSGVVTDPRTGARTPWRVARKGRLDAFLDAWLRGG